LSFNEIKTIAVLEQSIKVLDENVNYINLTLIKKYFSKEAWNRLKDIISTKKENAVYDCCVCQTDPHSEEIKRPAALSATSMFLYLNPVPSFLELRL
jgi:hypothetical protein